MLLDLRGDCLDVNCVEIIDEENDVWIADRECDSVAQWAEGKIQVAGVALFGKRNVTPFHGYPPHGATDLHGSRPLACQRAGQCFYYDGVAPELLEQQPGDAAGRIAAGFDLAGIDIENSHERISGRVSCRLYDDQLIATNTRLRIADLNDFLLAGAIRLLAGICNHEVIPQAMHFNEETSRGALAKGW